MSGELIERVFAACPPGFSPSQRLICLTLAHLGEDPACIETSLPALAGHTALTVAGVSKALQRMADEHGIDLRVPLHPTGGRGGGPLYAVPGRAYRFTLAGLLTAQPADEEPAADPGRLSDLATDHTEGQTSVRPAAEGRTLVRSGQTQGRTSVRAGQTSVRSGRTGVAPTDTPPSGGSPTRAPTGAPAREAPATGPPEPGPADGDPPDSDPAAGGRHHGPPVALVDLSTGRIRYRCASHAHIPVTQRGPDCERCAAVRATHQPAARAARAARTGRRARRGPPPGQRPLVAFIPGGTGPAAATGPAEDTPTGRHHRPDPPASGAPVAAAAGDPLRLDDQQLAINARGLARTRDALTDRRLRTRHHHRIPAATGDPPARRAAR